MTATQISRTEVVLIMAIDFDVQLSCFGCDQNDSTGLNEFPRHKHRLLYSILSNKAFDKFSFSVPKSFHNYFMLFQFIYQRFLIGLNKFPILQPGTFSF